jgi:hypothetical protein
LAAGSGLRATASPKRSCITFRPTQKLNAEIKAGTLSTLPLEENPYADWSAHLFHADRTHYILLTNTTFLYSTVLYSKGITDDSGFIERALSSIREFMEADGLGHMYQRFVVPATGLVRFAKALNRSVTGSMNDLVKFATFQLVERDIAPFHVGFILNQIPMTAIATNGQSPGFPRRSFEAAAGQQTE